MSNILYIPGKFDVLRHLSNNPVLFKCHPDDFAYIVHLIISLPSENGKHRFEDGFTPLYSPLLKEAIYYYKVCLDYLENTGVIEIDRHYKEGRSRRYRIANDFISDLVPYKVMKISLQNRLNKDSKPTVKKEHKLMVNNLKGLTIDLESAKRWIQQNYQIELTLKSQNKDSEKNPAMQKLSLEYAAHAIATGQIHFHRDKTVNRLHHNITNLKKELRAFLTYKGQKLIFIDINNSQPFLILQLFNIETYQDKGYRIFGITKYNLKYITTMFLKWLETVDMKEVQQFKTFVESGCFYEQFQRRIFLKCNENYTRSEVKELTFYVLFSDPKRRAPKARQACQIFKESFPIVFQLLEMLKQIKHNLPAILLQKIESYIIIDNVLKRLNQERPKMLAISAHDAVCTTIGNEHYVKRVMQEETYLTTGNSPKISFETYF
ncbi:hypothetical protein JYU23_01170 [bacterium AH-315-C07]|nr:hypothetical protein [bacterium AH-315-C07]